MASRYRVRSVIMKMRKSERGWELLLRKMAKNAF